MIVPPRPGAPRLAALVVAASLLLAGAALLASGCSDSLGAPGVGSSAQTTDALALLPTDADVLGMMNLSAARESGAMDDVLGEAGLGMVSENGSDDFEDFVRMTGFDPNEDLDRVYLAGAEGGPAAFVAYGRFDRERIERYLADQDDAEFEVTEVEGLPVYLHQEDDGDRGGFALVNDEMVIAGDEATLTAMIGRLGAERAPDASLQALLDRVEYPDGAWFVARNLARHTAEIPADSDAPQAIAARAADGMVVSMGFQSDGIPVRAFLVTRSGADTDDVADVLRGGLSAAKIGLKDEPAALDVIDRVEVDPEAAGVRVHAFLTGDFLASVHVD